jgi:hypothetical protein
VRGMGKATGMGTALRGKGRWSRGGNLHRIARWSITLKFASYLAICYNSNILPIHQIN